MTVSAILGFNQVGENQVDKYITINDALDALEQATNARYTNSVASAADVTLSDFQATRYALYVMTAKTGAFNLVFPSQVNTNNAQRVFYVYNNTAHACTVRASTGSGSTVVVSAGSRVMITQSYEDMTLLSVFNGFIPYDLGFFVSGTPADNGMVMKFVATRAFSFAEHFAGSTGHCGTNPTSTAVFNVRKNGSGVGTISIDTSGVFTFATSGGAVSFAAGDRLDVLAPTPQDVSLADVSVTFAGARGF